MFHSIKSLYKRLPSFSARFHIAIGLSSLLTTVVLLSVYLGLIPNREQGVYKGRIALAEAVVSASSSLLKRGDLTTISTSLSYAVERNTDLHGIEIVREGGRSNVSIGDVSELGIDTNASQISVPVLVGDQQWGEMVFVFSSEQKQTPFMRFWHSLFGLVAFFALLSFPLYYIYLGKMLKELNPSTAVPARVRSALDTIAEALLVLDSRGNVVLANAAFANLTGQTAEALLGTHATTLNWVHQDIDNPHLPWLDAFSTAEATRMDMIGFEDSTGALRKFIVNCSPVMGNKGKVNGVLISMDDVTLLEEKEVLLRQSMEAAEAANEAKTSFLSNMSHEIRTPMTAILGFTEVLKRGINQSESDRLRHLNTISNSGQHLLELINDVLDLSKVESGAMEIEFIECPFAHIANEVLHVLDVKAREKSISLDLKIDTDLPTHIVSDPSRLRQIITNLVGNAIKFTENGGVSVVLSLQQRDQQEYLFIKVNDSGIGMTEKQLSTIFDAFTQADVSITRRFGGTGLGLSISRKLSIAMGGDIEVSSVAGEGSTFMLVLPTGDIRGIEMLTPEHVFASFNVIEQSAKQQWRFPSARALVVDDAAENRELLSLVLSDLCITVVTGDNGQEALELLAKGGFDIVLMDIQMPVMDGYQAVAIMRGRGDALPIVALTANAMKGYEQKVLAAGFSHYMTKPIDLDRLTQMLANILGGYLVEVPDDDARLAESDKPTVPDFSANEELIDESPIFSSLAKENTRFAPIAAQFVVRLDTEFKAMQAALSHQQWETLANQAHWLKGSGGTVGYKQFVSLALNLEEAAKAQDAVSAQHHLELIYRTRQRIVDAPVESKVVLNVVQASPEHKALNNEPSQSESQFTNEPNNAERYDGSAAKAVISRLPMDNVQFRGIVERFLPKLTDQIHNMEVAAATQDWQALSDLAHWLKGSAGNVGFDGLTDFAETLEHSAGQRNASQVKSDIEAIRLYADRVMLGWQQLPVLTKSA